MCKGSSRRCGLVSAAVTQLSSSVGGSIVDMLHLIGSYQFVCGLLNTFEVPVPEGT